MTEPSTSAVIDEAYAAIAQPSDLSFVGLLQLRRGLDLATYADALQLRHDDSGEDASHAHLLHRSGLCWACGPFRQGAQCHAGAAIVGGNFFFPIPALSRYYGLCQGGLHALKTSREMEKPWFDALPRKAHPDGYPPAQQRIARAVRNALRRLERLPYLEPRPRSIGVRAQWRAGNTALAAPLDLSRWLLLGSDDDLRLLTRNQWRAPERLLPKLARYCENLERETAIAQRLAPEPALHVDARDAMQWLLTYRPTLFNEYQGRGDLLSLDAALSRHLQQLRAALDR